MQSSGNRQNQIESSGSAEDDYPETALDRFRYSLAEHQSYYPLVALGLLAGVATALVICSFLLGIELLEQALLGLISEPDSSSEKSFIQSVMNNSASDFERALPLARFFMVLVGALLLGVIYQNIAARFHSTGLNHTLVTLHKNDGRFNAGNFLLQFFGGILALGTGQSGGREGPGIHLGAACSTILAQKARFPDNSLRLLTACGAASAIAAAFNTPIAGVIFALEVILMDYTLRSFLPVIIAATVATVLSQLVFGNQAMFAVGEMQLATLSEIPLLIVVGSLCALAAILFTSIQRWASILLKLPIILRFALAGLITATVGVWFPQILGVGFDSIHSLLSGHMAIGLLVAICIFKVFCTALGSAVGMPIGIVGPSLFIGATLGAAIGQAAGIWYPDSSSAQFYALLAMGGVMGALLNAPLAAVIAVMELSRTTGALLPGILVVVVANLVASAVFRQRSANQILLEQYGVEFESRPISQALSRYGLLSIIQQKLRFFAGDIAIAQLKQAKQSAGAGPDYDTPEDETLLVLPVADRAELRRIEEEHDLEPNSASAGGRSLYVLLSASVAKRIAAEFALDFPERPSINHKEILERTGKNNRQLLWRADITWTVEHARQELLNTDWIDGLLVLDESGSRKGVVTRSHFDEITKNW